MSWSANAQDFLAGKSTQVQTKLGRYDAGGVRNAMDFEQQAGGDPRTG